MEKHLKISDWVDIISVTSLRDRHTKTHFREPIYDNTGVRFGQQSKNILPQCNMSEAHKKKILEN